MVMRIKVLLSGNSPDQVVRAVDSPAVVQKIIRDVLGKYLGIEEVGEADLFVLPAVMAVPRVYSGISTQQYGCSVRLTGLNLGDSKKDFRYDGLAEALCAIYRGAIEPNLGAKATFTVRAEAKVSLGLGESHTGSHAESFAGTMPLPDLNGPMGYRGGNRPRTDQRQQHRN